MLVRPGGLLLIMGALGKKSALATLRQWATAVSLVVVIAACSPNGTSDLPTSSVASTDDIEEIVTSTTSSDRGSFVLPATPVEDWWADYRRFGVGEACEAVAKWSQDGDISDPDTDRGHHYLECSQQDWPAYFFANWFDYEKWELFTEPELMAIRYNLLTSIELLEEFLDDVGEQGGEATVLSLAIDRMRMDVGRIEAYLDGG